MSAKTMGAVFELDLKHAEKLVLLAMADHADQFGERVFPSVGLVAWKSGYSERQVQRIIHKLVSMGLLEIVRWPTPTRPFEYHIHTEKGTPLPPFVRQYSSGGDVLSPGAKSRNQNDSCSVEAASNENENVTLTVNRTIKEPSRTTSRARDARSPREKKLDDESTPVTIPTFHVAECGLPSPQAWAAILDEITMAGKLTKPELAYFAGAALIGRGEDGTLIVGTGNGHQRDRISDRLIRPLQTAITRVIGPGLALEVVVTRDWLAERNGASP